MKNTDKCPVCKRSEWFSIDERRIGGSWAMSINDTPLVKLDNFTLTYLRIEDCVHFDICRNCGCTVS